MRHRKNETPEQNAARLGRILGDANRWTTGDDRIISMFTSEQRKADYVDGWNSALLGQLVMPLEEKDDD